MLSETEVLDTSAGDDSDQHHRRSLEPQTHERAARERAQDSSQSRIGTVSTLFLASWSLFACLFVFVRLRVCFSDRILQV